MDNANSKILTLNTVFTSCRVYRKDESSLKMEGSSKIAASLMIPEEIKLFCNISEIQIVAPIDTHIGLDTSSY